MTPTQKAVKGMLAFFESGNDVPVDKAVIRADCTEVAALRAALAGQEPASPTAGMNIAQRILHVGGRNNAAGYVEFGSVQAVEALVRQMIRDLPQVQPELCHCKGRPADQCPGEWEPGCDLGNNPLHAGPYVPGDFDQATVDKAVAMVLAQQQAAPVQGPTRPDILEKLSYHALERDDLTLDDCLSYLRTSGWHKVRGRTERELVLQITELLAASPQAQQPEPVQEPVAIPRELDVRTIMLDIVPGLDGMGEEVYAESVAEVESKLSEAYEELEDWRLGVRRLPTIQEVVEEAPQARQAEPVQEPMAWNQVQVCTWIGNQLMTQPSMFERNTVCKFVRSLGRSEKLTKHFPAPQAQQAPSDDTLYLLRRLLSNQHTLTGTEFREELTKIVEDAYSVRQEQQDWSKG